MNIEDFRDYCLNLPGVTEEFPFDETTLVFKVAGKIFALTDLEGAFRLNLKCDPEKAVGLREQYPCVLPGYHMNKKHWNTVDIDGSLSDDVVWGWIDDSFDLVVSGLSKKQRDDIKGRQPNK